MIKRLVAMLMLVVMQVFFTVSVASAQPTKLIREGDRVVFLGDSNTYAGHYVAMLDGYFRVAQPQLHAELINVGLPSETACGLSEPDHPFPRPNVHERLDRALAKLKPDVVVACYGMNDGIYYPLDDERFATYKKGMGVLIDKVKASGARLVLLTPPAYDPMPMRRDGKARPLGSEKYAWFGIYEGYDAVMARYAQWVMDQSDRVDMVIDIHEPVRQYLEVRRDKNPSFATSSDGVHFNVEGHRIIADKLWAAWGFGDPPTVPDEALSLLTQREELLRDAWLTDIGHKRPGTKAGIPLADAKKQAAELDAKIDAALK